MPGGENIGITINSKGLIVVGFYKVNDRYIAKETLKIGDKTYDLYTNICENYISQGFQYLESFEKE